MKSFTAQVDQKASIGVNVTLYPNVIIEEDVKIGDNCVIGYCEGDVEHITLIRKGARIRSGAVIYHGCTIDKGAQVGHNSVLRERTYLGERSIFGNLSVCEGDTYIGEDCLIHSQCHITKFCEIGDHTFIAPLFVGANDNAMTFHREGHGTGLKGFKTGRGVRIAVGVTVVPGVEFGEGCIVGAGSLVTKDVPPYSTVIGRPAREVLETAVDVGAEIKG